MIGQQWPALDFLVCNLVLPTVSLVWHCLFFYLRHRNVHSNVTDGRVSSWFIAHIQRTQKVHAITQLQQLMTLLAKILQVVIKHGFVKDEQTLSTSVRITKVRGLKLGLASICQLGALHAGQSFQKIHKSQT